MGSFNSPMQQPSRQANGRELASARRMQSWRAKRDPNSVQLESERSSAQAKITADDAEQTIAERNAFTMAQNQMLMNQGSRPVGGGTYADLRRRQLGPRGQTLSGLGAANRAGLVSARRNLIDTKARGAQSEINLKYSLGVDGKLLPFMPQANTASKKKTYASATGQIGGGFNGNGIQMLG